MPRTRTCLALAVLFAAAISSAQRGAPVPEQLVFTPYTPPASMTSETRSAGPLHLARLSPPTPTKWTVRRNNAAVLKEGKLDLSSGQDKIEINGGEPEMIYVAIEPVANSAAANSTDFVGGNTGRNNGLYAVGAAVAPDKIGLAAPRPADFDSFWSEKLAAQAKVPINPALTPVQTDTPDVEMNTFVLDALGSNSQGYVARPTKEGKYPALVYCSMRVCTL